MRLVNFRTLIVGVGAVALTACGDDVVVPDNTTVNLTLSSATCSVGQTVQLLATVNGSNSANQTVTYAVAPATGVVTLSGTTLTCAAPGSAIVTARAGNRTAQAAITVTPANNLPTSLQLNPSTFTVNVNGTQTITTITTGPVGANTAVTYRSSDTTIARVAAGTVAGTAVVTGVRVGVATIVATSTANPNLQAAATVTVSQSSVTSITATPSSVDLVPGGTITVVPNVQAPAGVSRAVTYQSNNTAVATVSATGVITAVSNGTAIITVASVADPLFTTLVTVRVQEAAAVRVTIQSVTFTNAAGNNVPVVPDSVAGPITVTLNVDPGAQRLARVEVLLGGVTVCSQSFSAAFAEALTMSELNGSADVQPIQCTINTAQFDSLGIARNVNGARLLQARVFTSTAAGAAPTQTATIQTQLTLRNINTFASTITTTPAPGQVAQALDPAGRLWRAGSLVINAFPVLYDSGTAASQVTVTVAGRTQTATTRNANGSFTITFPGASDSVTSLPSSNNLNGYTTPIGVNGNLADTIIVVGSVAGGGSGPAGTRLGSVRIDNQTPELPLTFALNQNVAAPIAGQIGTFINASFSFDSTGFFTYGVGSNGDFGGVDDVRAEFFAGATTATDSALTRVRSGADLIPTAQNNAYRLQARLVDRLGNRRNINLVNPAGNSNPGSALFFGVDIVAPTLAFGTGNAGGSSGAFSAATAGGATVNFLGTDIGGAGFGANAYRVSVTRLRTEPNSPSGSPRTECLDPTAGFAVVAATTAGVCPTFATNGQFTTPGVDGYYTYTASVTDQAGNRSTTSTQRVLVDGQVPVIGSIGGIPAILTGNQTVTFSTSAADNLDLIWGRSDLSFPTIDLRLDSAAIGSTADNTLTTQANATGTIRQFIRQLEYTDANGALTATAPERADGVVFTVFDGANNAAVATTPLTNVQAGIPFNTQPAANLIASFTLGTQNPAGGTGATTVDISGNGTGAVANSITLLARVTGPTQTLNAPFTRVDFYYEVGAVGSNVYRLFATTNAVSIQDPQGSATRTITYSFLFDPAATEFPLAGGTTQNLRIRAIGVSSNGDGLVSPTTTNVTLQP